MLTQFRLFRYRETKFCAQGLIGPRVALAVFRRAAETKLLPLVLAASATWPVLPASVADLRRSYEY